MAVKTDKVLILFFATVIATAISLRYLYLQNYYWYFSVVFAFIVAAIFRKFAKFNYSIDRKIHYESIGLANYISLIRGGCICIVAGSLWCELHLFTAILYCTAVLLDLLDGFVARITQRTSVFGEKIDIEYDALAILVGSAICIEQQQLPLMYVFVGMLRYLFVLHVSLRKEKPQYSLPPSDFRRFLAGVHMSLITVALFPFVPSTITIPIAYVFTIPFYFIFTRDWLWVIGIVKPNDFYDKLHKYFSFIFFRILPLLLSAILFLIYTNNLLHTTITMIIFLCALANFLQISVRFISFIVIIISCFTVAFTSPHLLVIITFSSIVISVGSNIRTG